MVDKNKTIRGLICCQTHDCLQCPYAKLDQCMTLVVNDALALLKEQEPVKPFGGYGFYFCGGCKNPFNSVSQKFCSECGKAVKWDG